MWIITQNGFVSLVAHETDPNVVRARARRKEHLVDTFDISPDAVIDLAQTGRYYDYRWHADIDARVAAVAMFEAVRDIEYTSHVKENVSMGDPDMYTAMLRCWSALNEIQNEKP